IAQYLTPGDVSIQSVGITPHIATQPVVITDEATDVFRSLTERSGEKDLEGHLDHASAELSKAAKPVTTVRYLRDEKLEEKIRDNPNDLIEDFEVEFARALLLSAGANNSDELLEKAAPELARQAQDQNAAIVKALKARGVDWAEATAGKGAPAGQITLASDATGAVEAGQTVKLTATITNTGTAPFTQLRALSRSDNEAFEGWEFLFGNVPPGETRTWTVPVALSKAALSRVDEVKLELHAADERVPTAAPLKLAVKQLERPRFALTWQLDDRERGNGDGVLQQGEEASITVTVRNVGEGAAHGLFAALRDDGKDGRRDLFIKRGRVEREKEGLAPGASAEFVFSFKVKEDAEPEVAVSLGVHDPELREGTSEKVALRVLPTGAGPVATQQAVAPRGGAALLLRGVQGADDAPAVATAPFAIADAELDGWLRVPMAEKRYAWVPAAETQPHTGLSGVPRIDPVVPKGPPVITLADRELSPETAAEAVTVSGEVLADKLVKDLLIYVNNRKVFFKSNAGGPVDRLPFSARVPLEAGVNRITLIARQDDEAASRRTVIVHREGASAP
ncbi:MAG: hypothetical protein KC613_13705, partial [Myxococcales bacterium]|nr:hypothetical protein [Myxococcales bacterium]